MSNKDHRQLVRRLRRLGYQVEATRGGHLQVSDPSGAVLATLAVSPSDHRAIKNARAVLRRHGIEL